MKSIIAFISLALLMVVGTASAASFGQYSFPLYSSATSTVKTSSAINVRGFATKSLSISGATLASNPSALVFQNMSGTVVAQCSQDSTVWYTCIANDYGQTAISRTTNGIFTWRDAFNYIRLQWTGSVTGHKLKAWFSWQEN